MYLRIILIVCLLSLRLFSFGQAQAHLSGGGTICPGDSLPLTVSLSGTPPWSIVCTYNINQDFFVIDDITATPYQFYVAGAGVYELTGVTDFTGEGVATGSAIVSHYTTPTAVFSGSRQICPGSSTSIPINLTGSSPWTVSVSLNNAPFTTLNNITTSIYLLPVSVAGNYTVTSVADAHCDGATSGVYTLSHYAVPSGTIAGNQQICQGQQAALTISLTGQAPWTFDILRNGAIYLTGLTTSDNTPQIAVTQGGNYTLDKLSDFRCNGTVSGAANITISPLPTVEISALNPVYSVTSDPIVLAGQPTGGTFSGPGVVSATSTFYPAIAGTEGSPHRIIYQYTAPSTGCSNRDTVYVTIIAADAYITITPEKAVYCTNDAPLIISGLNTTGSTGYFSITGSIGLTDHGDNTATLNPAVLNSGKYTLTYTYFDEIWLSVEREIEIEKITNATIFGFAKAAYCGNEANFLVSGTPAGGLFTGQGIIIGQGSTYYSPAAAPSGTDTVIYTHTSAKGCLVSASKVITLWPVPMPQFSHSDSCLAVENPSPVTFENLTISSAAIAQWAWNFGDPSSGTANTSSLMSPSHTYLTAGDRLVTLTATTINQCSASKQKTISLYTLPMVDFYAVNECLCDDIPNKLIDTSQPDNPDNSYRWTLYGLTDTLSVTSRDAVVFLSSPGPYRVAHQVTTPDGCRASLSRVYTYRPTYSLSDSFYRETFESTNYWSSSSSTITNSWVADTLLIGTTPADNNAWHMHQPGGQTEQSWVVSPCFDFSEIEKPFLVMDILRRFDARRDGSALSYSTDGGISWQVLGTMEDGVNWYDWYNIFGRPEGQTLGWSSITDTVWATARHDLDVLAGEPLVQFRVSYGSDGSAYYSKGFAFDNFFVGSRNKKLLFEHYTNASLPEAIIADQAVLDLTRALENDMLAISYHTPYGGADSIYLKNPLELYAKSIENGVTKVPYSLVGGGTVANWETTFPDENHLKLMTLDISPFDLEIAVTSETPLQASLTVKARIALDSVEIAVPIAVVEPKVVFGNREYFQVMRGSLTDGPVWYLHQSWKPGDTQTMEISQNPEIDFFSDEYQLIAYIRNLTSDEIIQSAGSEYIEAPNNPHKGLTAEAPGQNPILSPNPVGEFFVISGMDTNEPVWMDIYSPQGNCVLSAAYSPGNRIEVSGLSSGVYFVRLTGGSGTKELSFIRR